MNEVSRTVSEIYNLIRTYSADVNQYLDSRLSVPRVFDVVRRIRYVEDNFRGYTEVLKRPAYTIRDGGDCDDKTILAGSWFYNTGTPFRVVTTSHTPSGEMQHVYLEYLDGGKWIPFDATYERNKLGFESPYTKKIIWENPIMNVTEFMRGAVSLAGIGLTPDEIPGAEKANNIINNMIQQAGDWIGNRFKETEHLSYAEAKAQQKKIWEAVNTAWNGASQSVRNQMYDDSVRFNVWAKEAFKGWWNNAFEVMANGSEQAMNPTSRQYMTGWNISFPYMVVASQSDKNSDLPALIEHLDYIYSQVTGLQTKVSEAATVPGTKIIDETKYGQKTLSAGVLGVVPLLVAGGIALMFFAAKKKGRK